MLEGIHIQNFRCFEDFQLEGFGQVNLIGGLNNSGKTVLLEGIYLGDLDMPMNIYNLKNLRYNYGYKWADSLANTLWNDLFFNKKVEKDIQLTHQWEKGNSTSIFSFEQDRFKQQPSLAFQSTYLSNPFYKGEFFLQEEQSSIENKIFSYGNAKSFNNPIFFLSTKEEQESFELAQNYSQLELDGKANHVLEAVQLIDASINGLKIVAVGEPSLYATNGAGTLLPIEFFGDAIKKILHIIFAVLDKSNGIILIDEIENGIHYTNQVKVWQFIFRLAKEYNTQIFATTHSKEMADAFNKVALAQEDSLKASYIEMSRHYKTNKIIGTVLQPEILQHKIEHNQAFRGE